MILPNGTETKTTFFEDFSIAELFGKEAIVDTFERAFKEWKDNVEYCTELAIITNLKCWYWYENGNKNWSLLYAHYYFQVRDYALDHFKGKDFEYYFNMTD